MISYVIYNLKFNQNMMYFVIKNDANFVKKTTQILLKNDN